MFDNFDKARKEKFIVVQNCEKESAFVCRRHYNFLLRFFFNDCKQSSQDIYLLFVLIQEWLCMKFTWVLLFCGWLSQSKKILWHCVVMFIIRLSDFSRLIWIWLSHLSPSPFHAKSTLIVLLSEFYKFCGYHFISPNSISLASIVQECRGNKIRCRNS